MFEDDFSFDVRRSSSMASSYASSPQDYSRSVSPFTATAPVPSPVFSVGDLAAQFADQRIQRGTRICHDSCASYANNDDDAGWIVEETIEPSVEDAGMAPSSRLRTLLPPRVAQAHSPSQRLQRQTNARLLSSASHARDIAALVSRMVESNDQCSVQCPPESLVPDTDEGYDSDDQTARPEVSRRVSIATSKRQLLYRRSSELSMTGACVSKSTRFRKPSGMSRVRSTEKS